MGQLKQIAIAVDQVGNTLLGGYADETISSRAWRMSSSSGRWSIARSVIDAIFFWMNDHCFEAYVSERLRQQLPPELR